MFCMEALAAAFKPFRFLTRERKLNRTRVLDLPNELLIQIANFLGPDVASLNSLSRTTRTFALVVSPMLYRYATVPLRSSGISPLRASCTAGKVHSVRSLLAHGVATETWERSSGTTALHAAIMLGQAAIVEVFVQEGADVNRADENGWTPLHWAVMGGEPGITHTLLAHGARRDVRGRFGGGVTPLHLAVGMHAERGEGGMSTLLLEWGAGVDVGDYYGITPMEFGVAVEDWASVGLMVHRQGSGVVPRVRGQDSRQIKQRVRICENWWRVCCLQEGAIFQFKDGPGFKRKSA